MSWNSLMNSIEPLGAADNRGIIFCRFVTTSTLSHCFHIINWCILSDLLCVCSTAEYGNLIYYDATFIISPTTFGSVWLTNDCDMQPSHTSLSGMSRKGRANSNKTCRGKAVNLLVPCCLKSIKHIMSDSSLCLASKEPVPLCSKQRALACSWSFTL